MSSGTPRTDAALEWVRPMGDDDGPPHEQYVGSDFARELERENTTLRTLVAKAAIPCAYCGLDEISKCKTGFPGCARADDLICGDDEHGRALLAEVRQLRAKVGELEQDKARLDWLDKWAAYIAVHKLANGQVHYAHIDGDDMRQAIDAARSRERAPNGA